MTVKVKILSTILMLNLVTISGQNLENKNTNLYEEMNKKVCRIYIQQEFEGQTITTSGTGINIGKQINNVIIPFVFTANHVIENLLKLKNSYLTVYFTNTNNNTFFTSNLSEDNIIWRDADMDVAIIGIPKNVYTTITSESNFDFKIVCLENIRNGNVGQEVYMLGKRWVEGKKNISIYKKGIISAYTSDFPDYENIPVYLIDKMANKGMSGGLIFNDDYVGIALIIGYVLEREKKIRTSDDLTIGIPLLPLIQKLDSIILEDGDNIFHQLGY